MAADAIGVVEGSGRRFAQVGERSHRSTVGATGRADSKYSAPFVERASTTPGLRSRSENAAVLEWPSTIDFAFTFADCSRKYPRRRRRDAERHRRVAVDAAADDLRLTVVRAVRVVAGIGRATFAKSVGRAKEDRELPRAAVSFSRRERRRLSRECPSRARRKLTSRKRSSCSRNGSSRVKPL